MGQNHAQQNEGREQYTQEEGQHPQGGDEVSQLHADSLMMLAMNM
jgi:hypothetical protein